jgi:hypothetical protein
MTDLEIENKEINSENVENVENKSNERDCSICYSHTYANIITLCNHIFCISCLMQFRRAICPLCRNDLVNELPQSVLTIINNNTEQNNNLYHFDNSNSDNSDDNEHDIYRIINSRYNILPNIYNMLPNMHNIPLNIPPNIHNIPQNIPPNIHNMPQNIHINTPHRQNDGNFFNRMFRRVSPRNITQRQYFNRRHPYINHRLFDRINPFTRRTHTAQRTPVRIDDLMGYNINEMARYIDAPSMSYSDNIDRIRITHPPNLYNYGNGFLF